MNRRERWTGRRDAREGGTQLREGVFVRKTIMRFACCSISIEEWGWQAICDSFNIYVYVHTYIHIYMYMYIHVYIHICTFTHIYIRIYVYIYIYPCTHTQTEGLQYRACATHHHSSTQLWFVYVCSMGCGRVWDEWRYTYCKHICTFVYAPTYYTSPQFLHALSLSDTNTLSRSTSCVLSRLLVWYTHTHAHSCRRPAKTPQYSSLRDLLNKIKNVSLSHTPTRTYTAADGPWCVANTILARRRLDALAGQVYMYIYVLVYIICIYIQICTHTCIYIYTYLCIYVYIYTYTHTYIYVCI